MNPMKLFTIFKIYYTYICQIQKNIPATFAFSFLEKAWALGIPSKIGMEIRFLCEAVFDGEKSCLSIIRLLATKKNNILRSRVLNNDLVSMFSLWVLKPRENSGAEGLNQFGELNFSFLKPAYKWHRRIMSGRHLLLIISLIVFDSVQAQNVDDIKPLEIGDTIPDALWKMSFPTVNGPDGKSFVKFDDYKDKKLIILDFWATWCGSCIANMPRTHKMESEIDGVAFVPITFEPKDKTAAFIKTNHITDSLNIYSIVEDKLLSKYFPHKYLPHYVWISRDGVVRAITEGREVTSSNITRMLASPLTTHLAKIQEMDKTRGLLLSDDLIGKGLEQYSILIKGIRPEYFTQFFLRKKDSITYGKCFINTTLMAAYGTTATELLRKNGIKFNMTTDIILDVKEPQNIDFSKAGIDRKDPRKQELQEAWETDNLYSYDVILPLDKSAELYERIFALINDSTPYNAKIEKRKVDDIEKYVLIIKDDENRN